MYSFMSLPRNFVHDYLDITVTNCSYSVYSSADKSKMLLSVLVEFFM